MNSHRRDAANSKSSHSHAGRKYSKSSYNFRRFVDVWFCKLWLYKCSRTNCSYNYQSMLAIFGVINPSLLYRKGWILMLFNVAKSMNKSVKICIALSTNIIEMLMNNLVRVLVLSILEYCSQHSRDISSQVSADVTNSRFLN